MCKLSIPVNSLSLRLRLFMSRTFAELALPALPVLFAVIAFTFSTPLNVDDVAGAFPVSVGIATTSPATDFRFTAIRFNLRSRELWNALVIVAIGAGVAVVVVVVVVVVVDKPLPPIVLLMVRFVLEAEVLAMVTAEVAVLVIDAP